MVFSSLLFIFGFLPIFFTIHYLAPERAKNVVILLASYLFYAWGAPRFVFLLVITTCVDYILGNHIYKFRGNNRRQRQLIALSVTLNLTLLVYFKYANFFVSELNRLLLASDFEVIPWMEVALPVGISFFTFHKLSYIIDVYRGTVAPARSLFIFALYIILFPQLIAGPIIRYHDIYEQFDSRRYSALFAYQGIVRFVLGLSKKVLIADPLGHVADSVFGLHTTDISTSVAWIGILSYTLQIYYDFSGYSDMAIGLGRMMGFRFPENFNLPYSAQTITEFWRRWHISLSSWMREYLYIPLGGNRVAPFRRYVNLWIVFLLSGLWHGASWTFLFWGAFHGFFLVTDKLFWLRVASRLHRSVNVFITLLLAIVGWVFFRSPDLWYALRFLDSMFLGSVGSNTTPLIGELVTNRAWFLLALGFTLSIFPLSTRVKSTILITGDDATVASLWCSLVVTLACGLLAIAALTNSQFHPFIYFRF